MTSRSPVRPFARTAGAVLLAAGLLIAGSLPASAHVHVEADDATAGGFTVLTFRVPNESDAAGTVQVEATLPNDHPFLYVSTKPLTGWKVSTAEATLPAPVEVEGTTITKAVRTVTWTADRGTRIGPGEFQEFSLSVGPLPAEGTVTVPTTQTYSDGKVVTWDQPTPASGDEPEYPAPTFTVAAAGADHHGSAAPASETPIETEPAYASTSGGDTTARILGGIGLVLGAVALGVAIIGRRRGPA